MMKKKITFDGLMKSLISTCLVGVCWHFGDVYGTEYTLPMPFPLFVKLFFSYWGVKALLILAGIYAFYLAVQAIGRWHQTIIDKAVERALQKYLK